MKRIEFCEEPLVDAGEGPNTFHGVSGLEGSGNREHSLIGGILKLLIDISNEVILKKWRLSYFIL